MATESTSYTDQQQHAIAFYKTNQSFIECVGMHNLERNERKLYRQGYQLCVRVDK